MSSKFTIIFAVAILAILIAAIFANSMTKELGRDEHVYCTGGVLMAQGRTIYRDFSYIAQMPYHPLLYAVLFKILDTTYYLLTGRIASTISDILVVLCIVGIYRKVFDPFANTGLLLGIAAAVLYVFNPVVDYANGFAWNNDVVILCIVAALRVFISIDFEHKSRYQRIAIIGLLLTLATCMRITVVPVGFLFFIILLLCPAKSIKQRMKNVLPFLVAAVVVLAWPIWTIIHEPRAFFLNLLVIPKLNSQWLDSIGMTYNKTWLMLN
ncbi:MAG: glycosyltransferase family 39 protein, partial [Planctomycetota bacterium]